MRKLWLEIACFGFAGGMFLSGCSGGNEVDVTRRPPIPVKPGKDQRIQPLVPVAAPKEEETASRRTQYLQQNPGALVPAQKEEEAARRP